MITAKNTKKSNSNNAADFAFNPNNAEDENVGQVQAFHLLLMLLRYGGRRTTGRSI
jgi:hypothetical protein